MPQQAHQRQGFTLTEVMIVVTILGMLVSMAVPSVIRARNQTQIKNCQHNLRLLNQTAQQYLFLFPEQAQLSPEDLAPFFFRDQTPVCPAGGLYTVSTDQTVVPTCTKAPEGHHL